MFDVQRSPSCLRSLHGGAGGRGPRMASDRARRLVSSSWAYLAPRMFAMRLNCSCDCAIRSCAFIARQPTTIQKIMLMTPRKRLVMAASEGDMAIRFMGQGKRDAGYVIRDA